MTFKHLEEFYFRWLKNVVEISRKAAYIPFQPSKMRAFVVEFHYGC